MMSIMQMRKLRLRELSNLGRVASYNRCYLKPRPIWLRSLCTSNVLGSLISCLPTQQNLLSLFQTLGYWPPAVEHCDRHICTTHTFTSGLFPLTGCTSSSPTMQTLFSLRKPFSTWSLTSPQAHSSLKCELHNLDSVSKN